MAKATVILKINPTRVNVVVGGLAADAVNRAAARTRDRIRANITAAGRVDTGAMRDSISLTFRPGAALQPSVRIFSALSYTLYQERGIGPVTPVRAKVLRFRPKGSGVYLFRPRTRGFQGAHFMENAANSVTVADFL